MAFESGPKFEKPSCENEVHELISDLDTEFGSEAVVQALDRIFKPIGEITNLPPASDVLIKHLELIEKKFGHEHTMDALSAVYEKRQSSHEAQ